MWSTTPNSASDSKKKEEVDDCRCSSAAGSGGDSSGGSGSSDGNSGKQHQLQQLNVFPSNNKKSTSIPFGDNLSQRVTTITTTSPGGTTINPDEEEPNEFFGQDKELSNIQAHALETGDSGFISGPQIEDREELIEGAAASEGVYRSNIQELNISEPAGSAPHSTAAYDKEQVAREEYSALDSGCIDEDDFVEEGNNDNGDGGEAIDEAVNKVNEQLKQQKQKQQQQSQHQPQPQPQLQQVLNELPNATVAGTATTTTSSSNDPMILKQNVDAGITEGVYNLSLEATPRPQSQQPQQIPGIRMNNLNSSGRKLTATLSMDEGQSMKLYQQQQQRTAANATTPTTTGTTAAAAASPTTAPLPNITHRNAWEHFYQQNDEGDTLLHLACIHGMVDIVAALIRTAPHPCLFNIQNDIGQTPLHLASAASQPKIIRMLLIAGCQPTIRDVHGDTALHIACTTGEEQCVRALLLEIGASEIHEAHRQYGHRSLDKTVSYLGYARLPSDLEIRNYDGERCIHIAAQRGHIGILRYLLFYGADINAREGRSGRTALHIAIESYNDEMAAFLIDECTSINLETTTYAGLTAYQVACILKNTQMLNLLENRGAIPISPPDSDYDNSDIETDLDESKSYDRFGDPGYFVSYNGGNPMTVA